jgi:PAS domain S-box-containing protein
MGLKDPAFRAIFEGAPIGIAVIDRELRIVDANAAYCKMLGYGREHLLTLRLSDITHPEDRQRDIEFIRVLFDRRIPQYHTEKRYIRKDGRIAWGNLTALVLHEDGADPVHVFGLVEDITERRTLRGLLPVCSACKRVRGDKGYWSEVEVYLKEYAHTGVDAGLCPDCKREGSPEGHSAP